MFFDRFRAEIRRYADGVHELGDPAQPGAVDAAERRLGCKLPAELRELYRSWDGLRLFLGAFVIEPGAGLQPIDERFLVLGEALGVPIDLDGDGRLFERDELGDRVLVGSDVERWLHAVVAREGLMVDRDGEWKDVFESGDALEPEVARKRVRVSLKADPGSAEWRIEEAELAFDEGDDVRAEDALAAGVAWELLGGLHRRARRFAEAEGSYASAARVTRDPVRRLERYAEAARAASEAGRPAEGYAEQARAASPPTLALWLTDATARLEEGDVDGAFNLASLLHAAHPTPTSESLLKRARTRHKLRVI